MDAATNEIVIYWSSVIATLEQRGLLKERPRQGGAIIPQADGYLLHDRVIFNLNMHQLGGIKREDWLDTDLWEQWRATLQGRNAFVSDGGGLAICIARNPGQHIKRLPAVIPLAAEHLADAPYHVTLGHSKRGPVLLNLAKEHRAILIGGTTGGGKTNLMQAIILQLAAKHSPAEVQFAIIDTKEVDFGADYDRMPHLFAPIAHDLDDCRRLIERVENERLRRQAVMAAANTATWKRYNATAAEPLPLLVLIVDEAADFVKTATMKTLVQIARKGRSFGISVIVGTQHPTTEVIDTQVKANLPIAIALQTRTSAESRVILGRGGAEELTRPGLALVFLKPRWEKVQTLWVDEDTTGAFVSDHVAVERPALSEIETAMVWYAMEELDGAFKVNQLYQAHRGQISQRRLTQLAQRWEARGWLTAPSHATDPRKVTGDLLALVHPAQGTESGDRVIGMIGGDRAS